MSETIVGYLNGTPIYADASQQRTAHGADGKFVSGGGSAGGGKHAHLLGKMVTLGHPGGKSIWGGKVVKTHEGFEHDASLMGKIAKVIDVHPNGKDVLVEHEGKRHIWPAKHAKDTSAVNSSHAAHHEALSQKSHGTAAGDHFTNAASQAAHRASARAWATGMKKDHQSALTAHKHADKLAFQSGYMPKSDEHRKYANEHAQFI